MAADKFRPHHPEEFKQLMEWARGAKSVLEIGSRYGGTLTEVSKGMAGKRIVSVDLPGYGQWGNEDSEEYLVDAVALLKASGFDAHLILGNSRDPEVVDRVKALGPYDFIFIDGDHTYEGVKADWVNYGPMGKRVAFHDIIKPKPGENQALEVWRFWEELKDHAYVIDNGDDWPFAEFVGEGSKMGLGLVKG